MRHRFRLERILGVLLAACHSAPTASAPARAPRPGGGVTRIDPPATAGAMAPNLATADGSVFLTWLEPAPGATPSPVTGRVVHRLRFSRLADRSWSPAITIAEGDTLVANWADTPSVARSEDGSLVAHWPEASGDEPYAYDVMLARSVDGGATWHRIGPAHDDGTGTEHGFVSLLADRGAVRAFWLDGRQMAASSHVGHDDHGSGSMTLRSALVQDEVADGAELDARVCECCGTSAAMTSAGPVIVYRDRSADEVRDISIIRWNLGRWSDPVRVHTDGWKVSGCPVNGPAVAADGPRVAVAWFTNAEDRPIVKVAFSTDAGASFAAPVEVAVPRDRRTPLGRVDVVLLEEGDVVVSWMDSEREQARVLVRRIAADGRLGDEVEIVETSAERESGFPRLEKVGAALVVAWTETGASSQVRVARLATTEVPAVRARPPLTTATGPAEAFPLGSSAPDYGAVGLDGQPNSLGELRGSVVLLNVWATWCEPCRHELPELAALHARHAGRPFRVVGVSVDQQKTADELARFTKQRKVPFAIWHDREDRASDRFGISTLPATLLFDASGVLVWQRRGAVTADDPDLRNAIEDALARAVAAQGPGR